MIFCNLELLWYPLKTSCFQGVSKKFWLAKYHWKTYTQLCIWSKAAFISYNAAFISDKIRFMIQKIRFVISFYFLVTSESNAFMHDLEKWPLLLMLKNWQTYFKNPSVWAPQCFWSMYVHFSTSYMKNLHSKIFKVSLVIFSTLHMKGLSFKLKKSIWLT